MQMRSYYHTQKTTRNAWQSAIESSNSILRKWRQASRTAISLLVLILFAHVVKSQVTVSGALTGNGNYSTLSAAAAAIGTSQPGANIQIIISGNTTEPASGVVFGAGDWASINIQPSGGAFIITGAVTAGTPLIDFNGADNITINGLNTGGNALTISNTTVSAISGTSTIRFQGDATNNTITRCSILGSATMPTGNNGGNIWFGSGAISTGNDGNTISNCNIGPAGSNLPSKCIYFSGSSNLHPGTANSGISIHNNNIFDYFSATANSSGIDLNSGTTHISITNNRFYQTGNRIQTSTGLSHRAISINNTQGNSYTIVSNTIGGSNNTNSGNSYSITFPTSSTSSFIPIYLNVGSVTSTNCSFNAIKNISVDGAASGTGTSAPLRLMYINNGLTSTNNNSFGSLTTLGSISYNSSSSSFSEVYGIYNFSSASWTSNNNTFGSISAFNTSTNTVGIHVMRCNTATAATWTCEDNIIGSQDAGFAGSISASNTHANTFVHGITNTLSSAFIRGNLIANLKTNGGSGIGASSSIIGIHNTSTGTANEISRNQIHHLFNNNNQGIDLEIIGIRFTGNSGVNIVEKNSMYGFYCISNFFGCELNGISAVGGTTTYRNNIIAIGNQVANSINIYGIKESGGVNNFYHNSVHIGGVASALTGVSCAFISTLTNNTRNIRNNVFSTERTNTGTSSGVHFIIRVAGTSANPPGLTLNNNLYFHSGNGTAFGFFNGNTINTFADWKTSVGQDANSFFDNPQFSCADCYTQTSGWGPSVAPDPFSPTPTLIEGNGIDLGVVDDIGGNIRANLTPVDLGAVAGDFTGIDLTGPQISFSALNNHCGNGARTITATITDASGVPTSGIGLPVVYWSINAPTGPFTAAQMTHISGSTYQVNSIGAGSVASDIIYYFIAAQDNAATPNIGILPSPGSSGLTANPPASGTAPSTPYSYTNLLPLSGTYTVGVGGNYTTLTAAVADYNTKCLSGPVVFELSTEYYNTSTGEVFPISINQNPGAGPVNTLTIKPASGKQVYMVAANSTALIKLNGADYVTIDGDNGVDPGQNFLIYNTSTSAGHAGVWISSLGVGQGASNNIIRNCHINTGISQSSSSTNSYGIVISGSTLSGTHASITGGADNDNNTITNNMLLRARYGIYSIGASAGNPNTGNVIQNNTFGSETFGGGFQIGKAAIVVREEDGIQIKNNDIRNVGGSYDNATSGTDRVGITLGNDANWPPSNVYVKNAVITGNKIHQIVDERTYSAIGILLAATDGSNPTNNLVANNFIYDIKSNGTVGDLAIGIGMHTGNSDKIVFNTIYLTGDTDPNAAASAPNTSSYGLSVNPASVSNPLINNNIVFMDLSSSSAPALAHAAINVPAGFNWGSGHSNYNNFYINGSNAQSNIGCVGGNGGTFHQTLTAWQTASSQDANSVSVLPEFVSATDLHLNESSNANLDGLGTPIAGITTDIDNEVRNATNPDMGADEFTAETCTTAIAGTASGSTTFCNSGTPLITASGYSTGSGSTYQWFSSTNPADYPLSGTAISGQTNPAQLITGLVSSSTYYWLRVTCATNSSTEYSNMITITVHPASAMITGPLSKCANDAAVTLSETGGTGTSWLWSPGGETTSSITVNPGSTTVYSVQVTSPGGCISTTTHTLSINPNPTGLSAAASLNSVCQGEAFNLSSNADAPPSGILSQDFESGIGSWLITAASTGGTNTSLANFNIRPHGWNGGDGSTINFNNPGGSNFILADADGALNIPMLTLNTQLTSPVFSLSGYSNANLSFRHYYRHVTSNQSIQISINGGAWTNLKTYSATVGASNSFANENIPLDSYLGNSDVRIRFNYTGGWIYYWAIDDIMISGTPEPLNFTWTSLPSGFNSSSQNPTGVTQTQATEYIVQVTTSLNCSSTISTGVIGINSFNINASAGPNGSITPAGNSSVVCGDNQSFTISPDPGYIIADVIVDGISQGAVSNYTFNNVQQGHSISASFALNNFTITASAGSGGSISPAGNVSVNAGDAQSFTITPDGCYSIADVIVDGVSVGAVSSYTFNNVTANHTISVSFVQNGPFNITVSAGANGSISPSSGSVNCGDNITYTITAASCFAIDDVIVDGVSQGAVSSFTFNNVQQPHSISASFVALSPLAAPAVTGPTNVCPFLGNNVQVSYTATSAGATSYTWTLPPNVNLVSGQGTANITVTFNAGFATQANKQIRVRASNACFTSAQTLYYLLVQYPGTPAAIAASSTNVCPSLGSNVPITFSIPKVSAATSYIWTSQAGTTTIVHPNGSGVNDTTITVTFSSGFTTSAITVQAVNDCGTSGIRSITLTRANPSTPSLISGPTNACAHIAPNGSIATYTVPQQPNAESYNWLLPGGALNISGQGTNSISFMYPAGYTGGNISVSATNGCGTSLNRNLAIATLSPATPSVIDVMNLASCEDPSPDRLYSYSLASLPANASSVQWTVPASGTIVSGQGTSSITVSYPASPVAGQVSAIAVNNCGSSVARNIEVKLPACPPEFVNNGLGKQSPGLMSEDAGILSIQAFPNPAANQAQLKVDSRNKQEIITVRILDIRGKEHQRMILMPGAVKTFGASLAPGMYLIEAFQGSQKTIQKFIRL